MMQQEHVEILLEQIAGNTQLTLEGLDIVNSRLGRLEAGHDRTEARLEIIEGGLAGLKAGQDDLRAGQEKLKADVGDLKADVRDIKCSVGLLGSVAGDHETRLQTLESTLRDHVTNHS
jgi:hypothetical protein